MNSLEEPKSLTWATKVNSERKEANSLIFVHARYAAEEGRKAIIIKANVNDVLIITLSIFQSLPNLGLKQMCVALRHSQNLRWIGVHDLYYNIGPERPKAYCSFMP